MITGIIIMSLIFISLGFLLTKNNAKYLLAGYNTMKEEERAKYDIARMVSFMKKFFWLLGATTLFFGLMLSQFASEKTVSNFITFYPVAWIIYMLFEVNKNKYKK